MRKLTLIVCLLVLFCSPQLCRAQDAKGPLTGRWVVTADFHGTTFYMKLELMQQGDKLTGEFDGDKLEGTVIGNKVHFLAKDDHGGGRGSNGHTRRKYDFRNGRFYLWRSSGSAQF